MLTKISAWILTLLMPFVASFGGISIEIPGAVESAQIIYDFSNEKAGSAAGTVTVEAKTGGSYDIYWGDDDFEKLSMDLDGNIIYYSELAEVKVDGGKGSAKIQEFTAIPENAETVLAYKAGVKVGALEIPENKLANNGKALYNFGVLSDVHFNRYNNSLTGDDVMLILPNALNFLEKFGVKAVGISGDISNGAERDAFEKFNGIVSNYDFPVYTCTGNHDVNGDLVLADWQELMNTGVYGDKKREGVKSVAENGLDFVYAPEDANGDVFIFLSQYQWDYNHDDSRILSDAQLDWLENQLETYKDTTVYLFFHTFLNSPVEGEEQKMGVGNLINEAGHYYDLAFTEGCPDEVRFEKLMDKYENVIYFSGHSHWAFDMQKYNENINISDYNGEYATMIHVSSVSSPRRTTPKLDGKTEHNMRSSEGYVATVYEDRIVFTACEFLSGQLLSYATYVVER